MHEADQEQSGATPMTHDDPTRTAVNDGTPADSPRSASMVPVTTTETEQTADRGDQMIHRMSDVAQRLKPVAVVAENAAGKAVDLSARGLTRLSGYLERRRLDRHQQPEDQLTDD